MKKQNKEKRFLKEPSYIGGKERLDAFIKDKLLYPDEAREALIEGRVDVAYDINHKGKVIDAHVVRALGYGCDEEAIRLVKLLRFHVPKNRNVKVVFHKTIGINFRLPAKKAASGGIQYSYVPEKKAQPKPKEKTYTIRINYSG